MNNTELQLLQIIADMGDSTDGAFNIRTDSLPTAVSRKISI